MRSIYNAFARDRQAANHDVGARAACIPGMGRAARGWMVLGEEFAERSFPQRGGKLAVFHARLVLRFSDRMEQGHPASWRWRDAVRPHPRSRGSWCCRASCHCSLELSEVSGRDPRSSRGAACGSCPGHRPATRIPEARLGVRSRGRLFRRDNTSKRSP